MQKFRLLLICIRTEVGRELTAAVLLDSSRLQLMPEVATVLQDRKKAYLCNQTLQFHVVRFKILCCSIHLQEM